MRRGEGTTRVGRVWVARVFANGTGEKVLFGGSAVGYRLGQDMAGRALAWVAGAAGMYHDTHLYLFEIYIFVFCACACRQQVCVCVWLCRSVEGVRTYILCIDMGNKSVLFVGGMFEWGLDV